MWATSLQRSSTKNCIEVASVPDECLRMGRGYSTRIVDYTSLSEFRKVEVENSSYNVSASGVNFNLSLCKFQTNVIAWLLLSQ